MRMAVSSVDQENRKQILSYLNKIQKWHRFAQTKEYQCGAELLEDLKKGTRFDVIFLDVDAENVAKSIRELDSDVLLVFQAHSYDQIPEAFEVYAVHYLLKPMDFGLFVNALKRVLQRYRNTKKKFIIQWKQQIKQISLKSIVYIECFNRHILVQTVSNRMESCQAFRETAEKLIPLGFIRVHQSFLVNLAHIVEITPNEVIGTNGIIIPMSIRRKKEVLEEYRTYMKSCSI